MISAEEKTTTDTLIETLGKFIQEQAGVPPAPDCPTQVSVKQYLSLTLFCCNLAILYLFLSSLFATIINAPIWQLLWQIIPFAVGGSFILTKSKQMQTWLLRQGEKISFVFIMITALFAIGLLDYTQIPHFAVPIHADADVTQFCAEEVEDISSVQSAVEASAPMPSETCTGGRLQGRGEESLKHLKLWKNYRISVKEEQTSPSRYYLPQRVVSAGFFHNSKKIRIGGIVNVMVQLAANNGTSETLTIERENPDGLIYMPSGCWIPEQALNTTKCTIKERSSIYVELMPGTYKFSADHCKEIIQKEIYRVEDVKKRTVSLGCS